MGQRKLQIFLSSTYEDLIPQRLAAIEAILAAGHIPAAMEQFPPGDETAWDRIRTFIVQSDALILILGGRYGSIEPDTGKSYVQREFEYAVELGKPFFSIVVDEEHHEKRVKKVGLIADERERRDEYLQFRSMVTKRLCAFWSDVRDIKIAIFHKLPEWAQRDELVGWVRGDERPSAIVMDELARLSRENHDLHERLLALSETYDGLTFDELVRTLRETKLDVAGGVRNLKLIVDWCNDNRVVQAVTALIAAEPGNAGELFDGLHEALSGGLSLPINVPPNFRLDPLERILHSLFSVGLIASHRVEPQLAGRNAFTNSFGFTEENLVYEAGSVTYKLTDMGRRFRNRMLGSGGREKRREQLWSAESRE